MPKLGILSHGITPLDEPLLRWKSRAQNHPKNYLEGNMKPFGEAIAAWQESFFETSEYSADYYSSKPEVEPLRPDAPTIVTLFYPNPDMSKSSRNLEVYLASLANLARSHEQMMVYVPPYLEARVQEMRNDTHFVVVSDFETIWDFPNNLYQKDNFNTRQPQLFNKFDYAGTTKFGAEYDNAHKSAAFNAKFAVLYDAIVHRNPFGSDKWMYADAGLLGSAGPRNEAGEPWGAILDTGFLDEYKLARSIEHSGDSGIVIAEYRGKAGKDDMTSECWSNPTHEWESLRYVANAWFGSSVGMLNFVTRYMYTVDEMDANDFYVGREEFVIPYVAMRYPNTVFSAPFVELPQELRSKMPREGRDGKYSWSGYGGASFVPAIHDPLSTLYCTNGYQPRKPNLEGGIGELK
ncbi:hypothetical protein F4780DRAFT_770697 [Xylariomycetidae sp. FL0641]|nr:hypothetical protein F4780DRAFT_770697 [Xylariomycetidae sp. FL0641]